MNERVASTVISEPMEEPADLLPAEPDMPGFYDGDGPTSCEWSEGWCDELADHYTLDFCAYEDCEDSHTNKYCLRHYILTLGLMLDHLRECEGMSKAETPDEIRHCALEHIAGFGSLDLQDDRPAGVPDGADESLSGAELDAAIDRISDQIVPQAGDWKELKVGERPDRDEIEAWLKTLEFNHLDFHVEWLAEGSLNFAMPFTHRYDERAEQPDSWSLSISGEGMEFEEMNDLFDGGDFTPMVNAFIDPDDGRLTRSFSSDILIPDFIDRKHQTTDDPDKAIDWMVAIRETRTGSVLIVFPGAWIRWRAEYDGDFNQLDVRNWADWRRRIAPYAEYWDESIPLDTAKARAKAAALETALNRIIKDGIKPGK